VENEEGDLTFSHTKLILRYNRQHYYAITSRRCNSVSSVDIPALELHPIPTWRIWPEFTKDFTLAPESSLSTSFVKQHSLLDYDDTPASSDQGALLLNEARICEILKMSPHPNVVEYLGCVVEDGRITGLCFTRYINTLSERVRAGNSINIEHCLKGIEEGIRHIHHLGFIHCDINPHNILMDGDNPRVGDFDSCHPYGTKLGLKAGTIGWSRDEFKVANYENDWYGLSKIEEFLRRESKT
jgi:hypothetical protein